MYRKSENFHWWKTKARAKLTCFVAERKNNSVWIKKEEM